MYTRRKERVDKRFKKISALVPIHCRRITLELTARITDNTVTITSISISGVTEIRCRLDERFIRLDIVRGRVVTIRTIRGADGFRGKDTISN